MTRDEQLYSLRLELDKVLDELKMFQHSGNATAAVDVAACSAKIAALTSREAGLLSGAMTEATKKASAATIAIAILTGVLAIGGAFQAADVIRHWRLISLNDTFHLRTECAQLAEKTQPGLLASFHPQRTSHYDEETNRCYVEVSFAGTTSVRSLYDGQTGDLLVFSSKDLGGSAVSGELHLSKLESDGINQGCGCIACAEAVSGRCYELAKAMIDRLMADDRGKGHGR